MIGGHYCSTSVFNFNISVIDAVIVLVFDIAELAKARSLSL
jgi:hypothetical protein